MHAYSPKTKYNSYYDISIIVYPFTATPGITDNSVTTPLEFFSLFFSPDVKDLIYTEHSGMLSKILHHQKNTWINITMHVVTNGRKI